MMVLGFQGSPRKKGNTNYLLSAFMDEAETLGAQTRIIEVAKKNIVPCIGCGYCEKKGYCITKDDDMTNEIYPLLREADVVVLAAPIYFYNVPSQLKAPIDRTQTLWSRKYKLNLTDPARHYRRGFLLAQGATKGKNLFEGVDLTAKYFFDAVGAGFSGSLTYRHIENIGDMEKHSTVHKDVTASVKELLAPLLGRKKILFACRENACRSQMAAAFAQQLAGDKIEAASAGSEPAEKINLDMVKAMAEKGIDMGFRKTRFLDEAASELQPDMIITMGCGEACPFIPGMQRLDWDLPDPAGKSMDIMRNVRDEIEKKVKALINNILS
ncbi:MAG: NAD(P)H-dependent oxidoreductase [Desulfobacterales bacterium]